MIVVDTSALIAILMLEPQAAACQAALVASATSLISAGTLAEALVVAGRRGLADDLAAMVDELDFEVVPVTKATSLRIASVYAKWGKGIHLAGLNFGDCYAYDLARDRSCKLLFIGNDFSKTDIAGVL